MKLKLSQKNQLFDCFQIYPQLNPLYFKIFFDENILNGIAKTIIAYTKDDFKFEITGFIEGISLNFSPGSERYEGTDYVKKWDDVYECFKRWVERVNAEVTAYDKWENYKDFSFSQIIEPEIILTNEKFNRTEIKYWIEKLENLKFNLAEENFLPEQLKLINDKLDFVAEQVEHLGKFDWRSLFIGTIISIIIQLTLSQEQGKIIMNLVKKIFTDYFIP